MTPPLGVSTIPRVPLPPPEPLYRELCALRDCGEPTHPRHGARWRLIAEWLEEAFPGTKPELEDARQETLISLVRHVATMRAEAPLQAAKWVGTIHRRKIVDAIRAQANDPVRQALEREPRRADAPSALDRLEAESGRDLTPAMLERLVTTVLEHVHRALDDTVKSARKRQLRRTQAHATMLRLVCGWGAEAIEQAIDYGEPVGKDRLYKWVERGRAPVKLGLERWAEADPDSREVVEVLVEILDDRRADAGKPRPNRRKDRSEEAP